MNIPKRHRLSVMLDDKIVQLIKDEAARRNVGRDPNGEPWTWRLLAQVRASAMLEEWAREMEARHKAAELDAIENEKAIGGNHDHSRAG